MPRAVISGGTGLVGRFVTEALLARDYDVTVIGRTPPQAGFFSDLVNFQKSELGLNINYQPIFEGADCFVHCALDHVARRYVGGEGRDAKSFAFKNLGGTAALFKQAKKAGVKKSVFLSDQVVYGEGEAGSHFYETDPVAPGNIYAKIKHETENLLLAMQGPNFATTSLRLSNVYGLAGFGRSHKWDGMFRGYLMGKNIEPRASCEIHGEDVGRAVGLILAADHLRVSGGIFNAMDMVVDRQDILAPLQKASGCLHPLPERADRDLISTMNCDKLKRMEWRTGGLVKLTVSLERLIKPYLKAA